MKYSLVLVQPPLPANDRHKKVLPLGIAYLAAYIRKTMPEIAVSIIDGQVHGMTVDEMVGEVMKAPGGRKIVGITYWTCQAPGAFALSRALKKEIEDIIVIHGGIHATIFPREALGVADFCVLHEGEETLRELLMHHTHGSPAVGDIRGIAYHDAEEKRLTPPRAFVNDLDSIPFPAWDLLDMEKYDSPLHVVGGRRLPIIGSRGCPYGCTYCGSPIMWKKRVRWRSPENVLNEIKSAIAELGISQFHFWDDNLMLNRKYIETLCRLIVNEGLDIRWTGLTRASHIAKNGDLMGLMKEAGCIGLEVGIESANPKTFYTIQKDEDLQVIQEVARLHKKYDMSPLYTYMAFNPGESISGYYEQARFIDRLIEGLPWYDYFHPMPFPLYTGQFCTPHPGTKLYDDAPGLGMVLACDWSDYYHHQINFVPRSLLDDKPRRNLPALTPYFYELCNFALQVAFWPQFNSSVAVAEKRKTLARYRESIGLFWKYADGKRTLEEIALLISDGQPLDYVEAMRFSAFNCLILGQIGAIVSEIDDRERPRKVVEVAGIEDLPGWRLAPAHGSGEPLSMSSLIGEIAKGALSRKGILCCMAGMATCSRKLFHCVLRKMPSRLRERFSGYYDL